MKKHLLSMLITAVSPAGEMIRIVDTDFKKPTDVYVRELEKDRTRTDITEEQRERFVKCGELLVYREAMLEVAGPFFRLTPLKPGDDWREIWRSRKERALSELSHDKALRISLEKVFDRLREFETKEDAMILERVVRAKFGGEPAWIILVNWEREQYVINALRDGKEAKLIHILLVGFRISDQQLLARFRCD